MNSLIRRKTSRRRLRVLLEWEMDRLNRKGFSSDISLTGMAIKSDRVALPGAEISIRLNMDGKRYTATGIVRWAKQTPVRMMRQIPSSMGIEFNDFDDEFMQLLNALNAEKS